MRTYLYILPIIIFSLAVISASAQKNISIHELQYSLKKTTDADSLFRKKGYILKQSASEGNVQVYHYYTPDGDGPLAVAMLTKDADGKKTVEFQTTDKQYIAKLTSKTLTKTNGWKVKKVTEKNTDNEKIRKSYYTRKASEVIVYSSAQGEQAWYHIKCR